MDPYFSIEQQQAMASFIEELLDRRSKELKAGHPRQNIHPHWPRVWNVSELVDSETFGAFFHLKRGRRTNPPPRSKVMEIADYLECDVEERNRLLSFAGHAPTPALVSGDMIEALLPRFQHRLDYLPLPAYVVNRDWQILAMNPYLIAFFGIDPAFLATCEPYQFNILWLIFDPELPVRAVITATDDQWEQTARRNIYGFKKENLRCQEEAWYKLHVQRLMQLPDFARLWKEVEVDTYVPTSYLPNGQPLPSYETTLTTSLGTVRIESLIVLLGNEEYPQIVAYVPLDEISETFFATVGIPTPHTHWREQPAS